MRHLLKSESSMIYLEFEQEIVLIFVLLAA